MIISLKINRKSNTIKISDECLSNAIDAIAQKAKNVFLGVTWKWKKRFFHCVNFEKEDDVKKQSFEYNNEKGGKTVAFYDYYDHLKKHGLKWVHNLISNEVKISPDGKHLIKEFKYVYAKKI